MKSSTKAQNIAAAMEAVRTSPTVSVQVAADLLGISVAYGYEMARNGRLPVIELGPRRVRVRSAGLLRMIEGEDSGTA